MIDIVPGDVVVCVDAGPVECESTLHTGEYAKLREVVRVRDIQASPCGCIAIVLNDGRNPLANRFRKVKKADSDFTEYMRKMRPLHVREDA